MKKLRGLMKMYNFFRKGVIINIQRKEEDPMEAKRVRKAAASVISLTVAASLAAVLAGANNYYGDPNYANAPSGAYSGGSGPVINSHSTGNSNSNANAGAEEKTEETTEASILTAATVSDAIENVSGDNVTVDLTEDKNGNVTIMEDTIAAIANGATEIIIEVTPSSADEISYTVAIDPQSITDINGSLNIGMEITKPSKTTSVNGVKVPSNSVVITPKAKGNFGVTLSVTVSKDALGGMKATIVRPYAISGTGKKKKVVQLPKDSYRVNSDGSITVFIENGDASIVFSDKNIAKAAKKHGTA